MVSGTNCSWGFLFCFVCVCVCVWGGGSVFFLCVLLEGLFVVGFFLCLFVCFLFLFFSGVGLGGEGSLVLVAVLF